MRESQKTGRLRLRHLMERTEAAEEEMCDERQRFTRLAKDEARPRVVSSFNLFQTPQPLAARLAGMLRGPGRTLEPSAGLGRLYRAVREISADCPITLVEQAAECCGELYRATEADSGAKLVQADFLSCDAARLGKFESVIMNPPFKMGTDIKHIVHAQSFLCPGGRLVAICANGPRQRAKLQPIASEWHELPPGSFKEAYTNVSAAIVVIDA
jgi:hypothetical protein